MGILRSHNTPVNSWHFFHAAAILALMSSSLPPCAWITEPRYLKFSTCFRAFPLLSVICRDSAVFAHTTVSVLSAFTLRPLLSKASCHSLNLSWSLAGDYRPGSHFIWWNRLDLDQNRLEVDFLLKCDLRWLWINKPTSEVTVRAV